MFYRFNAHRAKKPEVTEPYKDRMARLIATRALSLQRRCTDFMGRQSKKLSFKRLKFLLFVFVLLTGASSIYIFAQGIWLKPDKYDLPKEPVGFDQWDYNPDHQKAMKHYLDSLEKAVVEDSINQLKSKQ